MPALPNNVIGEAYTSRYSWELLTDLVDIGPRFAGHVTEQRGSERIAEAYEEIGLTDIEMNEFEIPGWSRGESTLRVDTPKARTFTKEYQILALANSSSGTVDGRLVDVGYGLPEDFEKANLEGTIVLASSVTPDDYGRFIHRREKYNRAVDAGAEGFLFYNHVEGCLPPTGTVGHQGEYGPIPAAGISKEMGERLVRYCNRYSDLTGQLDVKCEQYPAQSQNMTATIGPDTDREVVVTAHVDSHDILEGARDNGVGSALVPEIARLLAIDDVTLDTRVRFLVFGSEEIGLMGSEHWANSVDGDDIKCVVNIDGAGYSRTPEVRSFGFKDPSAAFEEVGSTLDVPVESDHEVGAHSDMWSFAKRGLPGVTVSSYTSDAGRGWGHTHADTLDKLDIRDLRDLTCVLANAVVTLAQADRQVNHKSVPEVIDSIDEANEQEMKLLGRYPETD